MRILHVITGLTTGGAEAVLYRLVASSPDIEHEVVCLEGRAFYSDRLEALGVKVHHVDWTAVGTLRAIVGLHRLIRAIDADVVQTWMYRSNFFAGISSRVLGKPVVWNIRCSTFDVYPLATRMLARAGGRLARWIPRRIINCSIASQRLHARIGYDSCEGAVIPNAYDCELYHPDESARAATRDALGFDAGKFTVATISRWHSQKGLPELLGAVRLLHDRGVPVKLQMVGRGLDSANPELAELIDATGTRDLVQLIGERSDIPNIARAPDLHVVSSIGGEGFPNAIAETMLSGTPNVTTDVGDAAFIVAKTGWIVPPGDTEQLAGAIEQAYREWANSPEKWRQRRAAARDRIAAKFTMERMVEAYEEVWAEAAKKGTAQQPQAAINDERSAAAPPGTLRKPLRVLHIINSLTLGGAESLLYRLVTRDSANEHVVISLGRAGWYSSRLKEQGVPLHHLDMNSVSAVPGAAARLKRLVSESGADVVQCWMYRSNIFEGVIAKVAGKPVVWGIHCSSIKQLRPSSRAVVHASRLLARSNPDSIINCSTSAADLHAKLGYDAAKSTVIHNGYDSSTFFPNEAGRVEARKALGLSAKAFAIGSITRWDPLKDLPNLLASVRIAFDRGVQLRCFLIGAGLDAANRPLMDEIRRWRCEEIVVPLGSRSDVPNLARALDLHVLASRTEAFPNVVAETMLSGTPNAVTDVGDSAVMVGNSGWLVPAGSPDRLADAIVDAYREWKEKPEEWADRRKAARTQIADNFSIDRMAHAYEEVWRSVAAASASNPRHAFAITAGAKRFSTE